MANNDVNSYDLKSDTPAAGCRGVFFTPVLMALAAICMALALTGCVTDSGHDCEYPLRLRFAYVFNREDRDLLRDEVDFMRLCLYETSSGRLVAQRDVEVSDLDGDNSLEWRVPAGRHTLVVWGFSRDAGNMTRYALDGVGDGWFSHSLSLVTDGFLADAQREAATQSRQHLWHSCLTDILVNGDVTPLYDVELRKISNDVNVNVYVQGEPLPVTACHISATDGRYAASGQVSATVPSFYMPATLDAEPVAGYDSATRHEFTMLGLWASDDSHLSLTVPGYATPVYDGSLTELIDRLPRLDYDLDDVFNLDFYIHSSADGTMQVSVSVNDWRIVNYNVTLK